MSIPVWASCGALGDAIWLLGQGWTPTPIAKRLAVDYPKLSEDQIQHAILFAQEARAAAAFVSSRSKRRQIRSEEYPPLPED